MKVALLNPPMDFNTALGRARDIGKYTVMIPHGLASIAAILKDRGIECRIIDAYAENLTIGDIIRVITDYRADVVGISAVTPVMPVVHEIVKKIKEKDESLKIILGGPHPSILPEEVMSDPNVDFVVKGEGEYAFLNLLNAIDNNSDLKKVNGLSYRQGSNVVHNSPAEFIIDLDALPRPAYELLPMHLYTAPPQWSLASPSYQLIASRGCPYHCGFCYVGMGRKVRYKSAARVCDEIEYLIERHGCRQVVFVDTTFPFNLKHAEKICNEMIKRRLNKKIVWFTSTRVDIVNQKMLDLMHEAGCRLITFGIESGNQGILEAVEKGITLRQARDAVKMAKRAKIDVTASYVLGLPGETGQTILDTIRFAKELGTLYAQFNIIVPYPGTKVYKYAEENGLLRNRNWNNYVSLTALTDLEPPFIPPSLTKERMLALQKKAYNSFYFRPITIFRHVKKGIVNREFKKYFMLARVLFKTFK